MPWALQLHKTESHGFDKSKALFGFEHSVYNSLQKKRLCSFLQLLNQYFELNKFDLDETLHKTLRFWVICAHLCLQSVISLNHAYLKSLCCRHHWKNFIRRTVAADSYQESATWRLDVALVEVEIAETLTKTTQGKLVLWSAKVRFYSLK